MCFTRIAHILIASSYSLIYNRSMPIRFGYFFGLLLAYFDERAPPCGPFSSFVWFVVNLYLHNMHWLTLLLLGPRFSTREWFNSYIYIYYITNTLFRCAIVYLARRRIRLVILTLNKYNNCCAVRCLLSNQFHHSAIKTKFQTVSYNTS